MLSRTLCLHIETSSLWAKFVNENRCISVRLVSEEVKSIDNFDDSHNNFLWPEYFIDFLCKIWIPCQTSTSVLCLLYLPETVHYSTEDAQTSEITFLALHPWLIPNFLVIFLLWRIYLLWNIYHSYIRKEKCVPKHGYIKLHMYTSP